MRGTRARPRVDSTASRSPVPADAIASTPGGARPALASRCPAPRPPGGRSGIRRWARSCGSGAAAGRRRRRGVRRTARGCASRGRPGRPASPRRRPRARSRRGAGAAPRPPRPSAARCAGSETCCQSHPPHRPGPANGQGAGTRSGDASRISTASARRKFLVSWVTWARTRSPGSVCRTKTTRPSCRATHEPPLATALDLELDQFRRFHRRHVTPSTRHPVRRTGGVRSPARPARAVP